MNDCVSTSLENIKQEAVAWHVRVTSGALTTEMVAEFGLWLKQSSAHEAAYREIEKLWQDLPTPLIADQQRRKQQAALAKKSAVKLYRYGLATAASIFLALLANFYPDYLKHPWADYQTHIGEQKSITLADGSVVHLNTNSAINVTLTNRVRQITLLQGEVEFEVAHDESHPFLVTAGGATTEALGTKFIVRYENDTGTVTLLAGKVRTSQPSGQGAGINSTMLLPGQQVVYNAAKLNAAVAVNVNSINAWRKGRLSMNFVPLKQVIAEINRYQRQQIKLLDNDLANKEINIAVDISKTNDWLNALQKTIPIKITHAGPFVFLFS